MDVQVYSSKEKASVIVDGKVVRDDPVTRVNGPLSLFTYSLQEQVKGPVIWVGWGGGGVGF